MTDKPHPLGVSDHAVLRFIERVYGLDVEAVRMRILTPTVLAAIAAGATAITVEGVRFTIRGDTIVTAYEGIPNWRKRVKTRTSRRAGRDMAPDDAHERVRDHEEDG